MDSPGSPRDQIMSGFGHEDIPNNKQLPIKLSNNNFRGIHLTYTIFPNDRSISFKVTFNAYQNGVLDVFAVIHHEETPQGFNTLYDSNNIKPAHNFSFGGWRMMEFS
jgi:hypothetical protein